MQKARIVQSKIHRDDYSQFSHRFSPHRKISARRQSSDVTQNLNCTQILPAFQTIYKKFAYLSTVYQMLINQGVVIENIAIKVCQMAKQKNNDIKN